MNLEKPTSIATLLFYAIAIIISHLPCYILFPAFVAAWMQALSTDRKYPNRQYIELSLYSLTYLAAAVYSCAEGAIFAAASYTPAAASYLLALATKTTSLCDFSSRRLLELRCVGYAFPIILELPYAVVFVLSIVELHTKRLKQAT